MSTPNTNELSPLLTPLETSKILGVTTGTMAMWRSTKRYNLRWTKIGRMVMYDAADIRAFVEERKVRITQ